MKQIPRKVVDKYFKDYFIDLHNANTILSNKLNEIQNNLANLQTQVDASRKHINELEQLENLHYALSRSVYQNSRSDRDKLRTLRQSNAYKTVVQMDKEPLVSVRIATYHRAKQLTETAIPSVLNQTYQNFEIVVVGDHTDEETGKLIKKIGDKRIRYYNLPHRPWYPQDKYDRWLVVGTVAANEAIRRCKGDWIATLDDDDSFRSNHLESLVKLAKEHKAEMVYTALESTHLRTGKKTTIWSSPPEAGNFSLMSALYMRQLTGIFMVDELGWVMREPQDWYLCRRMMEAGVSMYGEKIITGDINLLAYNEK